MLRIWDIMGFMREAYQKDYAANTQTIRRQTIHQFEQARIVNRNPDEPLRPTNSGKTVYRLTDEALLVLKSYGSNRFRRLVRQFCENFGTLDLAYQRTTCRSSNSNRFAGWRSPVAISRRTQPVAGCHYPAVGALCAGIKTPFTLVTPQRNAWYAILMSWPVWASRLRNMASCRTLSCSIPKRHGSF